MHKSILPKALLVDQSYLVNIIDCPWKLLHIHSKVVFIHQCQVPNACKALPQNPTTWPMPHPWWLYNATKVYTNKFSSLVTRAITMCMEGQLLIIHCMEEQQLGWWLEPLHSIPTSSSVREEAPPLILMARAMVCSTLRCFSTLQWPQLDSWHSIMEGPCPLLQVPQLKQVSHNFMLLESTVSYSFSHFIEQFFTHPTQLSI